MQEYQSRFCFSASTCCSMKGWCSNDPEDCLCEDCIYYEWEESKLFTVSITSDTFAPSKFESLNIWTPFQNMPSFVVCIRLIFNSGRFNSLKEKIKISLNFTK